MAMAIVQKRCLRHSALPDSPRSGTSVRKAQRSRKTHHAPTPERLPILQKYFDALILANGQQSWWPGRAPFEVIVGAILVQNTAWKNAQLAITNLREAGLLSPAEVERTTLPRLGSADPLVGLLSPEGPKAAKPSSHFCANKHDGSLEANVRAHPPPNCASNSAGTRHRPGDGRFASFFTQGTAPSLSWTPTRGEF